MTDSASTQPAISVVMAAYNAAPTIQASIDCVLGQTFADFELIVVDDASTDATAAIVEEQSRRDPRVKLVSNPRNLGAAEAGWAGIQQASGRFIARLDADDIADPAWLGKVYARLAADPGLVLCGCWASVHHLDTGEIVDLCYPDDDAWLKWAMLFANPIFNCGSMWPVRVNAFYDREHIVAHDYATWIELWWQGRIAMVEEVLITVRAYSESLSARRAEVTAREMHAIRSRLIRRLLDDPGYPEHKIEALLAVQGLKASNGRQALAGAKELVALYRAFRRQYGTDPGTGVDGRIRRRREWCLEQCRRDGLPGKFGWLAAALRLSPPLEKPVVLLRGLRRLLMA